MVSVGAQVKYHDGSKVYDAVVTKVYGETRKDGEFRPIREQAIDLKYDDPDWTPQEDDPQVTGYETEVVKAVERDGEIVESKSLVKVPPGHTVGPNGDLMPIPKKGRKGCEVHFVPFKEGISEDLSRHWTAK